MQSTIHTEKLSRSQRELASMIGPESSAGGLGSNVPSVMGSNIWDDLADSARVRIEDLELSDEVVQALTGQEDVVRKLLLAVHSAGRNSIEKSVGLLRGGCRRRAVQASEAIFRLQAQSFVEDEIGRASCRERV